MYEAIGRTTAVTLRDMKPDWDDERLKRWVLRAQGFAFSRREGLWRRSKEDPAKIKPELTLEQVLSEVAKLDPPNDGAA